MGMPEEIWTHDFVSFPAHRPDSPSWRRHGMGILQDARTGIPESKAYSASSVTSASIQIWGTQAVLRAHLAYKGLVGRDSEEVCQLS